MFPQNVSAGVELEDIGHNVLARVPSEHWHIQCLATARSENVCKMSVFARAPSQNIGFTDVFASAPSQNGKSNAFVSAPPQNIDFAKVFQP